MTDWFNDLLAALARPSAWRSFRHVFVGNLVDEGWRYVVFALVVWGLLHVLLKKRLAHRVIVDWPTAADLQIGRAHV